MAVDGPLTVNAPVPISEPVDPSNSLPEVTVVNPVYVFAAFSIHVPVPSLFNVPVPVPMMLFSIFTGLLQAYIFTLLTCVYIGGAVQAHK